MFRKQFHFDPKKVVSERFSLPSMTEPDNAMSIPEIISRYMRGHGIQVAVLPDISDAVASEDDYIVKDDPDMFDPFGTLPADPEPADSKAAPDGASQSAPSE